MTDFGLLTETELEDLSKAFKNELNYEFDDPTTPIDPISYRAPDGDTCLHIASRKGDLHAIKLLIKAGCNINALGDMGTTPLHCSKTQEVTDLLVQSGASLEIKDDFGRLPKDAANENNRK